MTVISDCLGSHQDRRLAPTRYCEEKRSNEDYLALSFEITTLATRALVLQHPFHHSYEHSTPTPSQVSK
jgi:hypothetical protein